MSIVADIEGADIYLDGRLVGETPTTLKIAAGQHKIQVKDQSGQTWSRDVEILDDTDVKLRAKLTNQ